ncbi:DUF7096 domain-containing protein [Halobaculum marinum]|uniref:DUF7096 domain-containing protein n=1 Tax=Halobaculum marinum TaxID=3031996 RepID=A0ABD5WWP9_9EURY|nr:hypothetical protein [Halobaculum sp. DT55]
MTAKNLIAVALALLLVVGSVPAAAVASPGVTDGADAAAVAAPDDGAVQQQTTQNDTANESVNVTVGGQLSTVLAVTDTEVESEFAEGSFRYEFERAENDSVRAAVVAERAATLRERAASIAEDYRAATEAYESGDIDASAYGQRIATLNARAESVTEAAVRLERRAENVSALDLRVAGYREEAVAGALGDVENVSGVGASALLRRFTGETTGELRIETGDGLQIEAEGEDGERSREIERPRDDDTNFTVSQADALDTARAALASPPEGSWTLTATKVREYEGAYEFEFALSGTQNLTGEAKVRVDASSGVVYRLEEETEHRDEDDVDDGDGDDDRGDADDEGEDRDEDEQDELAILVADGTPAPNATVTLLVLSGGDPAADVAVEVNGQSVGTTDADGRLTVTLPDADSVEVEAEHGDVEAELEYEFRDRSDAAESAFGGSLDATATVANGSATVRVTFDGSPVSGATVVADDGVVGTTDADGRLTFPTDATDELEVVVTKGQFRAAFEFESAAGGLSLADVDVEDDAEDSEGAEEEDDVDDAEDADDDADDADDEADDDRDEADDAEEEEEADEEEEDEEDEEEEEEEEEDEEADDAEEDDR